MNYKETLKFIHSLGNFSLPAGLERIKKVLDLLGNPQDKITTIHIAGTNGKGSVSAMLSNVFKTAGYKTGLFISPYIIDFRERIQINGEYISENDLVSVADKVLATDIRLTEFEFITAMAFLYFAEQNIDILICETGLGGRLDATNSLERKKATVITKIGMDHTAVLGDTIEKIASEKCGILRFCPTVTSPFQDARALNVIKSYTDNLYIPDLTKLTVQKSAVGNSFIYNEKEYRLRLFGDYQVENALIAIETVKISGYDIPYNIIYDALAHTHFPARMEIISKKPLVILDGAHNPDGGVALSEELKKHSGRVTAVIGMMKDKDCKGFLKTTLSHCKSAIAVQVDNMPRSLTSAELCDLCSDFCRCTAAENYLSAIKKAISCSQGEPIFVFGSLYLASAMRPILLNYFK